MKALITLAVLTLLSHPLAAQVAQDGRFAAAAYDTIPPDAVFRIKLLDDSDLNLRLQSDVEQTLTDLGYGIGADGPYELSFVTDEITDIVSYEDSSLFQLNINTTSGLDPHTKERGGTESRTRLWSTTKDSVFARHGQIDAGAPLLRIEFEIRQTTDKPRVVWIARAESATRRADRYRLFQQMIPVILENLGSTVTEETIVLR